ncbi:tetratricopeptide repeat protein [Ectopseudomonas mendocina]|uniref:Tetratricopeptide repeat protein n=1 Tax=Ectopseudomonas mendocina TaxID=300 RepID=A0ABZ2RCL6_ECTME
MNKSFALLYAALLLSGCQTFAPSTPDGTPPVEDPAATTPEAEPKVYRSFSQETIYSLLAAELAGQRNRYDIALDNYVVQAEKTQDAGVAERGFRIAEYLGADQEALDTSLQWAKTAPNNVDAQRAAAVQLARAGRYDESMTFMEKVLQQQGDTHFDFLALSASDTDSDTREGLLQSFDRLLAKYPDNSQLQFGKALLLQQEGQNEEALELLEDQPSKGRPVASILLHSRLLQSLDRNDEALSLLKQNLKQYPDDKRLRLSYARLLVAEGRLDGAKGEFASLLQQFPDDDDLRFSLALVCLEAEDWKEAIIYLKELVARDAHVDAAHYNLARAYEELEETDQALAEYRMVGPGNEYLPAQAAHSELLFSLNRGDEAAQYLSQARDEQPDYAIQLYLIEAEAWSRVPDIERSWQVVKQALEQFPDDLNLLYSRSMLSEKRNDLVGMEKDLRFILKREPDNAMALNALGYTLADRTTRYEEAKELIDQAYQLNPTDPAILDSLGWINYRLGKLDEAEFYLRKALQDMPDSEVAAHLGEVLWVNDKQKEARQIWRDALKEDPQSRILRSTIKRLTGTEKP